MKLKTLLLTILLITGIGFQNCSDDYCDCCTSNDGEEFAGFFDILDLEVKHLDANYNLVEENQIPFDDYGFTTMHFLVDYIVQQQKRPSYFSLINTLNACSPLDQGYLGSKEESIESLQIISLNDFDEEHNACLLYTSPSPRDGLLSRMPSSA